MKRFKQIHVVPNTHWDREFKMSFQRTRMLLVRMMDYLIGLLESDPEYASYTLDAHTILVEDYLDIRPENRGRVKKLVEGRRLLIGPWYTLPDMSNIGAEPIVRNLLRGRRLAESLGHCVQIGYTPCSWGQTGQLPQIYSLFGIRHVLLYRGISPHQCDTEFIWQAPDGTRALANRFSLFARYNYYYLVFRRIAEGLEPDQKAWRWEDSNEIPFKIADRHSNIANYELLSPEPKYRPEKLVPAVRAMLALEGSSYALPYFLAMHGHDISWPHPLDPKAVRDADAALRGTKVLLSNLETYCRTVEANADRRRLDVLKGELRSSLKEGNWTYLLPATISARTPMKVADFLTEMKLVRTAEPLAMAARMATGAAYPARYLDLAWRYFLGNHTHDAHAGCAPDHVSEDVLYRYRQSQELAEGVTEGGLREIAARIDGSKMPPGAVAVGVFNSLPVRRRDIVEAEIALPAHAPAGAIAIRDRAGREIPCQVAERASDSFFVDSPWNVPGIFDAVRFRVYFDPGRIGALGYRTFTAEARPDVKRNRGGQVREPGVMENRYLRVRVNANGSVDVTDKKTAGQYRNLCHYLDQGEAGNAWRHAAPDEDRVIRSLACPARIVLEEDGPLLTTYRADIVLDVPARGDDERRSDETVELPIRTWYTLKSGLRRLEVRTEIDNRARDHWLRMVFPTGIRTARSCADSHFDLVKRPVALPSSEGWKEPIVGTYPLNSFVDLSNGKRGLAVLTRGLREYEVFDTPERPIAVSLLRGVRIKLEVSETKKQELPDVGPQCPGRHAFGLALCFHDGDWQAGNCFAEAAAFTTPLRIAQFGAGRGDLPLDHELLRVASDDLVVTCIKKAERDDALVVRLFNPTRRRVESSLRFARAVRSAEIVNLNEEPLRTLTHTGRRVAFTIGRKKILTLRVNLR